MNPAWQILSLSVAIMSLPNNGDSGTVRNRKVLNLALIALSALSLTQSPVVYAADAAATISASGDAEEAKKDIEKLLAGFEKDWNTHNLDTVMAYYADDYVNNDGFDKKAIQQLTSDLWKAYPDIKSSSLVKQVRVEGPYATVESKDEASGNTADEMSGLGTKGELKSLSEGQLYLKKTGSKWRIIGDRIDYEKIRVSYGLARQLEPTFSAPEQVRSGKQYSARLEVELPTGLAATGSISQATVLYPLPKKAPDKFKQIGDPITEHPLLERVMTANTKNRNELLMASIALTNASGNSIMGYVMLTRRLNVIPVMEEEPKADATASAEQSETKASHETPESNTTK